jgi:hypothetical protein
MTNDRAAKAIKEVAKEILDSRTDAELTEAIRAMAETLRHFDLLATEG